MCHILHSSHIWHGKFKDRKQLWAKTFDNLWVLQCLWSKKQENKKQLNSYEVLIEEHVYWQTQVSRGLVFEWAPPWSTWQAPPWCTWKAPPWVGGTENLGKDGLEKAFEKESADSSEVGWVGAIWEWFSVGASATKRTSLHDPGQMGATVGFGGK